jgi:hypothetical protein
MSIDILATIHYFLKLLNRRINKTLRNQNPNNNAIDHQSTLALRIYHTRILNILNLNKGSTRIS